MQKWEGVQTTLFPVIDTGSVVKIQGLEQGLLELIRYGELASANR
jgi:hypothetical protein